MADCLQRAGTVCLNVKVIRSSMPQGSRARECQRDADGLIPGEGYKDRPHRQVLRPLSTCCGKLSISIENTKSGSKLFVFNLYLKDDTCGNVGSWGAVSCWLLVAIKRPPFRIFTTQKCETDWECKQTHAGPSGDYQSPLWLLCLFLQ